MRLTELYKKLGLFVVILGLSISTYAQNPSSQQIRELKIEFVSEKIQLKPTQEKAFIPIYNAYNDELHKVRLKRRAINRNKDAKNAVTEREKLDKEVLSIKSKYNAKFLEVIDSKQLNELHRAEDEFRKILMKRWKDHKH